MPAPNDHVDSLELLSRKLQELYSLVLEAERPFHPHATGLELLHQMINDPAWGWLRPLSSLIAEIDHVLAQPAGLSAYDPAVAAARVRGLLFGDTDLTHEEFLQHYRLLLTSHPALASVHGEIRRLARNAPSEPENESERLHARHVWAEKCKHRGPKR